MSETPWTPGNMWDFCDLKWLVVRGFPQNNGEWKPANETDKRLERESGSH
jgi:hypothetical protein